MPRWRLVAALALGIAPITLGGCKSCHDDELEEAEERDQARDHFWRVQVQVTGEGTVRTHDDVVRCWSATERVGGACGPVLFRFKEGKPPLLDAVPQEGWRLDRWESSIRAPDGAVAPRQGPMPDGRYYINGFGYTDTGELETVTAVFVPRRPGARGPG